MRGAAGPRRAARLTALTAGVLFVGLVGLLPGCAPGTDPARGPVASRPGGPAGNPAVPAAATGPAGPPASDSPAAPGSPALNGAPPTPDSPAATGTAAPRAGATGCPPAPTGRLDPGRLPEPPAGATVKANSPSPACTYVVGYATVNKLHGAMVINDPRRRPTMASLGVNVRSVFAPGGYFETDTIGDFRQPPSRSTFLGFGIEPVTAVVSYTNTPLTISSVQAGSGAPTVTTIGYTTTLHLSQVRVNGVPLDVGPGCRAPGADIELVGRSDQGYELIGSGGPMKGTIDIPPFTGCGTGGENLDPLLTGMVSGPHNYLDMVQSPLCSAGCAGQSPPALPTH